MNNFYFLLGDTDTMLFLYMKIDDVCYSLVDKDVKETGILILLNYFIFNFT